MNYLKIPKILPFWFVPATSTPGKHFDDDWACQLVKSFETRPRSPYRQKWIRSKTTRIRIESSVAPEDLLIYNVDTAAVVKNIAWGVVYTGATYTLYEAVVDFTDLDEGAYSLYLLVDFLSISWAALTEPIHVKDDWGSNVLAIRYTNSFNDFDVAWLVNDLDMTFFVEAAIMDYAPDRDRSSYVNQVRDITTLKATPTRTYKFHVGEAPGVAPWVIDLLNRIWCCDSINVSHAPNWVERAYQSTENAKWEVTRVKNWPLIGGSLEIAEAKNLQSLEFADTAPLSPGVVSAYEIETDFFGPGSTVNVTEVEKNG